MAQENPDQLTIDFRVVAAQRIVRATRSLPGMSVLALGVFFLTGWSYHSTLDGAIGVSGLINRDFNYLASIGAGLFLLIILAVAFNAFVFALLLNWVAGKFLDKNYIRIVKNFWMRSAERHGEQGASRAVHRRLAHIFTAMFAAMIILQVAAGALYGSLAAEIRIWLARRAVTGECRECFNYLLKDRHVRGIPISADKDRVAVLISPGKIVLLMWAEVSEITDARVHDGAQAGQRLTQP